MSQYHQVLLKRHEELVNLYIHQNKVEWNFVSVYVVFNMGLAGAVATLLTVGERMGAIADLCFLGFIFGLGGFFLFRRLRKHTSVWIEEGKEIEKALKEFAVTSRLFQKCENFKKERPKIQSGMLVLTVVWLIALIWSCGLHSGLW